MANPTGLLHGGMQCALMDDTIGMMTATLGFKRFVNNPSKSALGIDIPPPASA